MSTLSNRTNLASATALGALLLLTGCGSEGVTRIGSIGSVPPGATGSDGSSGQTGSTGSAGQDGGSQLADNGGNGANGNNGAGGMPGNNGTNGNDGGGAGTPGTVGNGTAGTILVSAGNAVLGLAATHNGLAQSVDATLPVGTPVTGTVTAVLTDAGQTLVDVGNGQTVTLDRAAAVVGEVVKIDLGSHTVVSAPDGSSLVGAGVLSPTPVMGTVASVDLPGSATTLANGAAQTIAGVTETAGHVVDIVAPGAVDGHGIGSVVTGPVGTATAVVDGAAGAPQAGLGGIVDTAAATVAGVTATPVAPGVTGTVVGASPTGATSAVTGVVGTATGVLGAVAGAAPGTVIGTLPATLTGTTVAAGGAGGLVAGNGATGIGAGGGLGGIIKH